MPKTPPISASDKKLFRESVGECTPTPGNKSYTKKPRNTRTNHPPLDEPLPPLISYAVGEITPITPEQVIAYRKVRRPRQNRKSAETRQLSHRR